MDPEQFRDDDPGYLSWVATHGHGYVINIQRSLNPADAGCYTINGQPSSGRTWTGRS
jgi:hypothetical protein